MKKYLILAFIIGTTAGTYAQDHSFSARVTRQQRSVRQQQTNAGPSVRQVGALPRAAQGNPIQLLNPAAPARYFGPPEETVAPGVDAQAANAPTRGGPRYTGLILFGLRW
jgi:hypothetical protein